MYDIITLTGLQVDRSFDDNFQATYAFSVTVLPSGHGGTITHIKSTLNYGETTKYADISVLIKSKSIRNSKIKSLLAKNDVIG